uniref:Major capsid protein n=1 Tax=Siphoviridae sp. ctXWf36 TaxID=2825544 RepID=A0A8S5U2R4_9CAUD|nr:MAG TPA: major capsid protein [Siphoviridae sp. ctXWf36]
MAFKYDFSGYVTKNDLRCSDGRVIRAGAFADQDGVKVPLVWNHDHRNMSNVVGHAMLENRDDGVYGYGVFNDTPNGVNARELVAHGDICAMSIYANKLKQSGSDVLHGVIREVSLVYAGANPGAYIDTIISHEDGADEEAIMYFNQPLDLSHGEVKDSEKDDKQDDKPNANNETIEEFFNKLSKEKREVAEYLIGMALKDDNSVSHSDVGDIEDKGETDDDNRTVGDLWKTFTPYEQKVVKALIADAIMEKKNKKPKNNDKEENDQEEKSMNHNAFDTTPMDDPMDGVLTHADQMEVIKLAKQRGSLRDALAAYAEDTDHLQHGIENIETLFPDYKDVKPGAPELLTDELAWVTTVMNGVHKSPISRIRTRQVDARGRKFRGKGYQKGNLKKEGGNAKLLSRTTDPCTVYVKDSIHRDDIIDITDFDAVTYIYNMQRMGLNEEIATAILFGDGREEGDEDKIPEDKIRPIWTDDELFTIHKTVDVAGMKNKLQGTDTAKRFGDNYVETEAIIEANLDARIDYKGSGSPVMFATPQLINTMLMARDLNGRRIYNGVEELKSILNVSAIHTVEQMNGLTRETTDGKTMVVQAIILNLNDYSLGATKGGEITQFNQFDIDFNKEKYLLETRCSGALTKVKSCVVLEKEAG